MSFKEGEGQVPEPPEKEWPAPVGNENNQYEEEEATPPFGFNDSFYKSTTFHGNDAQLGAAVIAHEVKGILKSLLGF